MFVSSSKMCVALYSVAKYKILIKQCCFQFSSLFARTCDLRVCLTMWDVLLQHADTFLVFFLALVLLVNAKYVHLTVAVLALLVEDYVW